MCMTIIIITLMKLRLLQMDCSVLFYFRGQNVANLSQADTVRIRADFNPDLAVADYF